MKYGVLDPPDLRVRVIIAGLIDRRISRLPVRLGLSHDTRASRPPVTKHVGIDLVLIPVGVTSVNGMGDVVVGHTFELDSSAGGPLVPVHQVDFGLQLEGHMNETGGSSAAEGSLAFHHANIVVGVAIAQKAGTVVGLHVGHLETYHLGVKRH
jgi:hypothetical protein